MSLPAERPLSKHDLLRVMSRHKKKLVLWNAAVLAGAAVVLFVLPKEYYSEAKLFVRLGRESVTLDPTATTGQTVQVVESRENQINSVRDMLESRKLLEQIVAKLGPKLILDGPPVQKSGLELWIDAVKDRLSALSLSPTVTPEEQAIEELAEAIHFSAQRNSSVITIGCTTKWPQISQRILKEFLAFYKQQHLVANRTSGSQEFFDDQAALLRKRLDSVVAKLRDAKNQSGVVSIAAQQQALQDQMTEIETAALATESQLASSEASIRAIQKALKALPKEIESERTAGFPNMAADFMQQDLYKLRIQLEEAESKFTENHPTVIALRDQLKKSEAVVAAQPEARVQTTMAVNPSRQSLMLDLEREEIAVASLRAKAAALADQLARQQERLKTLNAQEVLIAELSREVELAEANYRTYADNLEQARIDQALEENRISNVNVVQPPTYLEKPTSPKPLLVVIGALMAMVAGSVALAFGCELFDQTLKLPEEVEASVGLPVLTSIPRTPSRHVFSPN